MYLGNSLSPLSLRKRFVAGGGGGPSEIGHYKMNDDAADTTIVDNGSGSNNGTLVGGDTTADKSEVGKINDCLHLNGSDDYITIHGLLTDVASATTGALCFWIWLDADTGGLNTIFAATGNGAPYEAIDVFADFGTSLNDDGLIVRCVDGGVNQWIWESDVNFLDGKTGAWHKFDIVQDGVSPVFYWDSVDITSVSGSFIVSTDTTRWFNGLTLTSCAMGSYVYDGTWYDFFDGKLDDARVYNEELSQANIDTLYNSGNGTENSLA